MRSAPDPKDLKALASVKLADTDMERGSSLDTFDPSDPFRPPKKVTKKKTSETTRPRARPGTRAVARPRATRLDGGGDTGSTGGDTGSTGGGDTGSTGGGTGGSAPTQTVQYRYVVDVTFIANGRTRHIKGLERLDMLPSQDQPLLLFLGVTTGAGNAVFLVDSTLDAAGEGKCKPKASECAFLYIGAGSEHAFTNDDGDSYRLRIDEIRKVQVGARPQPRAAERARTRRSAPRASRRRFSSPLIADEESCPPAPARTQLTTRTVDRGMGMRRLLTIICARARRSPCGRARRACREGRRAPTITRVTPMRVSVGNS